MGDTERSYPLVTQRGGYELILDSRCSDKDADDAIKMQMTQGGRGEADTLWNGTSSMVLVAGESSARDTALSSPKVDS